MSLQGLWDQYWTQVWNRNHYNGVANDFRKSYEDYSAQLSDAQVELSNAQIVKTKVDALSGKFSTCQNDMRSLGSAIQTAVDSSDCISVATNLVSPIESDVSSAKSKAAVLVQQCQDRVDTLTRQKNDAWDGYQQNLRTSQSYGSAADRTMTAINNYHED